MINRDASVPMWGIVGQSAGPPKWAGKTDPVLDPVLDPAAQDPILSSMRLPRGRDPILSTQRISYEKS